MLPVRLIEEAKRVAKEEDRSLSSVISRALNFELERCFNK